jgi:hypothetical protein
MGWLYGMRVIALIAASATPVFAQTANFGNLIIIARFSSRLGASCWTDRRQLLVALNC